MVLPSAMVLHRQFEADAERVPFAKVATHRLVEAVLQPLNHLHRDSRVSGRCPSSNLGQISHLLPCRRQFPQEPRSGLLFSLQVIVSSYFEQM